MALNKTSSNIGSDRIRRVRDELCNSPASFPRLYPCEEPCREWYCLKETKIRHQILPSSTVLPKAQCLSELCVTGTIVMEITHELCGFWRPGSLSWKGSLLSRLLGLSVNVCGSCIEVSIGDFHTLTHSSAVYSCRNTDHSDFSKASWLLWWHHLKAKLRDVGFFALSFPSEHPPTIPVMERIPFSRNALPFFCNPYRRNVWET